MSQIKTVKSVDREVIRLNSRFDKMVEAANDFTDFIFHPYHIISIKPDGTEERQPDKSVFNCSPEFHSKLTKWNNTLIIKTPTLPSSDLPFNPGNPISEVNNLAELAKKMKMGDSTANRIIEGIVLLGINVPIAAMAGYQIVPYTVPLIFSTGSLLLFFSPKIIEWYAEYKRKEKKAEMADTSNPSDWISKDIQKMSDQFDSLIGLIALQEVKPEQLPHEYKLRNPIAYSREQQEIALFPNECLSVVRKIMNFCTSAYYELHDSEMGHFPSQNQGPKPPQSMVPQY